MPTAISQFVQKELAGHPNCWTCNLPESKDLNDAFNEGVQVFLLVRYLVKERGYDPGEATEGRLRGHFRRRHHLEES